MAWFSFYLLVTLSWCASSSSTNGWCSLLARRPRCRQCGTMRWISRVWSFLVRLLGRQGKPRWWTPPSGRSWVWIGSCIPSDYYDGYLAPFILFRDQPPRCILGSRRALSSWWWSRCRSPASIRRLWRSFRRLNPGRSCTWWFLFSSWQIFLLFMKFHHNSYNLPESFCGISDKRLYVPI